MQPTAPEDSVPMAEGFGVPFRAVKFDKKADLAGSKLPRPQNPVFRIKGPEQLQTSGHFTDSPIAARTPGPGGHPLVAVVGSPMTGAAGEPGRLPQALPKTSGYLIWACCTETGH